MAGATMLSAELLDPRSRYHAWILRRMPTAATLARQRLEARRWRRPPTISILTPIFDTPPELLRRAISSVRHQSYPFWQLCLVDDGSPSPVTWRAITRLAAQDSRIRIARRDRNGGIVAASNDALALATGPFVALLDHDDEIEPHALHAMASELIAQPETDVVYSDLDVIGVDGVRYEPMLQPDWSPELLLSVPYVVHLTAFRTALVRAIGGFRAGYEGSQDYDLALRISRETDRIVHVHDILYHWRAWARSAAMSTNVKPYAYEAGERAIIDHLRHSAFGGRREPGWGTGLHSPRYAIAGDPLVSLIAPLGPGGGFMRDEGAADVGRAMRALARLVEASAYRHIECVMVVPPEAHARALSVLGALMHDTEAIEAAAVERFRTCARIVASPDARHDGALAANAGAAQARGDHLLLLGELLEARDEQWLLALLEFSQQPGIGAAGPRIYRADGPIWSAGIVVPRALPSLVPRDEIVTRNYSAVSGACLMTRRASFEALGGFAATAAVGCSDVDYCLRLRDRGERIVLAPHARVRALDPLPFLFDARRREIFARRWGSRITFDPYYNRNYRQDGTFLLALD